MEKKELKKLTEEEIQWFKEYWDRHKERGRNNEERKITDKYRT